MERAGTLKLKARLKENGETQADLARVTGLSLSRLNAKLNQTNGAEFNMAEIRAIKQHYDLSADELDSIFFV